MKHKTWDITVSVPDGHHLSVQVQADTASEALAAAFLLLAEDGIEHCSLESLTPVTSDTGQTLH